MHIFIKVGGWIKLLKHVFAIACVTFSQFLKKFLARYARSIAFYPPLRNESMQCASPTPFIFFSFLGGHYP